MRSELGKELRKLFRKMMTTEFPEYREDKGQTIPQGTYVWTHRHTSGIWLHILFAIHPMFDKFTIESAWGFDGKLPPVSYDGSDGIFDRPVWFRINFSWSGKDYWWLLVLRPEEHERFLLYKDDPIDQCLPLVAPAVADAARKLKEHWVPATDKIVQLHGKQADQRDLT
jgi:hypothetical protein